MRATRAPFGSGGTWVSLAILLALLVTFGSLRWTGELPYGSDDDENTLVAQAIREMRVPSVAGIERTKYPFGYPLLLTGFKALGLPITNAGVALNWVCMLIIPVSVFFLVASIRSIPAALVAGAYVSANAALWQLASSVRADLLFALLVVVLVSMLDAVRDLRGVITLTLVCALATSLRSIGALLGFGAGVQLFLAGRDLRRWSWLPVVSVAFVPLVQFLWVRGYPEHTTGYLQMLMLRDPFDASMGRASLFELMERPFTRAVPVVVDLGNALIGPGWPKAIAAIIGMALFLAGVMALKAERPFLISFACAYGMALTFWPYSSIRFGMPLVPIAAVGLGALAERVRSRGWRQWTKIGVLIFGLSVYVYLAGKYVVDRAAFESEVLSELHFGTSALAEWVQGNVPEKDDIASFDYRELTLRLDRRVLPLSYTSDVDVLWEMSGGRGADWIVTTPLVAPLRAEYTMSLIAAYPQRFRKSYENTAFSVYEVVEETGNRRRDIEQ
jgi:hypothetical protein